MLSDSVQTAAHMLKNEAQRRHKTYPEPHSKMAGSGRSECRPDGLGLELGCPLTGIQRRIPCLLIMAPSNGGRRNSQVTPPGQGSLSKIRL